MIPAPHVIIINTKRDDSEGLQNMLLWRIDSKPANIIQDKHSDLLSFSEKQEIKFLYESCPSYTRRKVTFLSSRQRVEIERILHKQTLFK